MNIQNNPALRNKLAAEYVLGTLKGGARRRFRAWLAHDADLRNITNQWQARLLPMAEFSPAVEPSKKIWRAIEKRLNFNAASRKSWLSWLDDNLAFWKTLGMASTALATILVAVLVTQSLESVNPVISHIATLTDEKAQTAMIVTADTSRRILAVKVVAAQAVAADKTLQLWAVPKDGVPRSLGLIAHNQPLTLALPADATSSAVAMLAVSLEPKGGSPNPDGPTGPILYKGAWIRI